MNFTAFQKEIFSIKNENDFNVLAIEVFRYQIENTKVYGDFVQYFNKDFKNISHFTQIPFLPISFYKSHTILNKKIKTTNYFQSSGTTESTLSKNYIADENIYKNSIKNAFEHFIGNPKDYIILGLLPSYLENTHSSLIYMVNYLMEESNQKESGYFLYNFEELDQKLKNILPTGKKILLFGVSFALLDFAEKYPNIHSDITIIETGGMKGRKIEITKEEVLMNLKKSFPNAHIYSEYSMTELFSQAYSLESNLYQTPSWMKILVREINDPFSYVENGNSGAINIIDLANINTCSFIATQDIGKTHHNGTFEVLGRMDNSDIRGCSLLVT